MTQYSSVNRLLRTYLAVELPPEAHRTSNMVDRLMKFLDRVFFNAQYFHGLPNSAESRVR